MKAGQTLEDITVRALQGIGEVIRTVKPDIVLVHGDTSTTFAASLAAFYNQTKIGMLRQDSEPMINISHSPKK